MIPVARRAAAIQYAIRDVVVPATALEAEGHEILKFNIGDPLAYPGLPTPDHMIRAYATALENQVNGYGPSYGIPELRAAIAASEQGKTNGGWSCRPEDVYVTAGVTEALNLLFATVLEPGDVVLSPGPHYPPYLAYPQLYGARTVEYRLDPDEGWRIDLDDLASKLDHSVRLLVLIDPNNPTGSVLRPEEVDAVMTLASDHPNLIVVADEIYDGLDFTGQRVSIASRAKQVPVVTLNGVSKVYFAPGWRLGYLALHDPDGRLSAIRDGLERLLRARLCPRHPPRRVISRPLKDRRIGWKPIEHVCSVNGIVAWNASLRSMASMLIDRAVPSTCSCESHTRSMRLTTEASSSICCIRNMCSSFTGQGSVPHMAWVMRGWCSCRPWRSSTKHSIESTASCRASDGDALKSSGVGATSCVAACSSPCLRSSPSLQGHPALR